MNEEIKLTDDGVVLVRTIQPTGKELPELSENDLLKAYKETITYALNKRIKHCMDDLQVNAERLLKNNSSQVTYERVDGTFNTFNKPAYEAMQEALELVKEDKYSEFTALQWGQLLKAIIWVNKNNLGGFTFAQLYSYCLEMFSEKCAELICKQHVLRLIILECKVVLIPQQS